jgi:hypothetical protein
MSFWDLNDGQQIDNSGQFEMGGGDLEPIPNGTGCISAIEEAKWDEYEGDRYISLKWKVIKPDQYGNRVIYQKIKVYGMANDKDPRATADKAKRMLAAIDANAGGKLMKVTGEPSDTDLMSCLVGKVMAIKVMVWKMKRDGEEKSGNWIGAVAPAKNAPPAPVQQPVQQADTTGGINFDDDVPFRQHMHNMVI